MQMNVPMNMNMNYSQGNNSRPVMKNTYSNQRQGKGFNHHQGQNQGQGQSYGYNINHTNKPNQRNNQGYYNNTQEQEQTKIGNNKPKQPENIDPAELEEYAAEIYDVVESRYEGDAGKITGMIVDFGLEEMKTLLKQKDKLEQVIDEAYEVIK